MKKLLLLFTLMVGVVASAQWESGNFVDEFGDPSSRTYEQSRTTGTFSNSATTNSSLIADVTHQSYNGLLTFSMAEYSSSWAHFSSYGDYKIRIKLADGTQLTGSLTPTSNQKSLYLYDTHAVAVAILSSTSIVKAVIINRERPSLKYVFTIKAKK